MSATLQLVADAVGGNAAGAAIKNVDLGALGNTIAGALGGGGMVLTALLPLLQGAAGLSIGPGGNRGLGGFS